MHVESNLFNMTVKDIRNPQNFDVCWTCADDDHADPRQKIADCNLSLVIVHLKLYIWC